MKTAIINIHGVHDITQFVEQASKVSEPGVTVHRGQTKIDGSSLMGMLALDTEDAIKVEYPEFAVDFENFITKFIK